jgi:ubiquitin-like modifier-activating enzyme ATG7
MIDAGFWSALTKKKLDEWKLDDSEKSFSWIFQGGKNFVRIEFDAFQPQSESKFDGALLNFNTIDEFKRLNKKEFLVRAMEELRSLCRNQQIWQNPQKLLRPKIITFADLKKYHYYYWMCFPYLKMTRPIKIVSESFLSPDICKIVAEVPDFVFLMRGDEILPFSHAFSLDSLNDHIICFKDHANVKKTPEGAVGVMTRNLIALLWTKFKRLNEDLDITVRSIRSDFVQGKELFDKSKEFVLRIDKDAEDGDGAGWELYKGKMAAKKVDLSASMDTKQLAANAVDLNLKLMKWRLQSRVAPPTVIFESN